MFLIGERINGMFADVGRAIKEKNKEIVKQLCQRQISSGADCLDVNCGPASRFPKQDIQWLVETVQEATDKPICIDSSNPEVIRAALEVSKNEVIINSTTADKEKIEVLVSLAKEHNARLVALTLSSKGVPQTKDQRLELAAMICETCQQMGFSIEDLFIDPVLLPINVAQKQLGEILESIREFKLISDPAPKTIIGLSNVSQGTKKRELINRTFLTMAVAYGLDAAILDVEDSQLIDSLITAELVMNKQIYCDSFLEAYKGK